MILSKEKFQGYVKAGSDYIITTSVEPTWLGGLLGVKEREKEYRGDCTVWHHYPSGKRCCTFTEAWLSDIWQQIRWQEGK